MSHTEYHRGKATRVEIPHLYTVQEYMLELVKKAEGLEQRPSWAEDTLEWFEDVFQNKYYFHQESESLYKLENKEFDPNTEAIIATPITDTTFDYLMVFYNGGASYNECMDEAYSGMLKTITDEQKGE